MLKGGKIKKKKAAAKVGRFKINVETEIVPLSLALRWSFIHFLFFLNLPLARPSMGAMGVVLMSKKKTKNWLHVPARAKSKNPLFPEKETEVVAVPVVPVVPVVPAVPAVQSKEEEEIPETDDPVVIRGSRVNLLGKFSMAEAEVLNIKIFILSGVSFYIFKMVLFKKNILS